MHICEDIEPYKDTNSPSTTCGLHVLLPCFFFVFLFCCGSRATAPTIFKHLDKHNNSAILEMKTQDRMKKESQSNKLLLLLLFLLLMCPSDISLFLRLLLLLLLLLKRNIQKCIIIIRYTHREREEF